MKPFMAYCIFHESWIYPKSTMPLMGFIMCMEVQYQITFFGFMNYRLVDRNWCSGGQGGRVNAPRELGVLSPKLGISWKNGSFGISLGELCSALWSISWCEVCLASVFWKVCSSPGLQRCLFVVLVQRIGILIMFSCPLFASSRTFTMRVVSLSGCRNITLHW